ncbi:TaqI-like C-terminal specificity domain-containing protein, partial [Porphyromonas gulae]
LANCQSEDERVRTEALIRPILRGRDIKKYGYDWAGLWIIYIPWHFPLQFDETIQGASEEAEVAFQQQYPAVFSHMLQYKDVLSKRNKAETGIRYEWYALQRWGAKYWEDFEKPKIIYPNMTKYMPFVLDQEGYYTNQKCFILTGEHLPFLTAFFNSKIFKICYRNNFPELQGGTRELSKIFFEEIYIPKPAELILDDFYPLIADVQAQEDYADLRIEQALILALDLKDYQDFILSYEI